MSQAMEKADAIRSLPLLPHRNYQESPMRLFGEQYCADNLTCVLNSQPDFYFVGDPCEGTYVTDGHGTYYELHDVTGTLVFSMPVREERR